MRAEKADADLAFSKLPPVPISIEVYPPREGTPPEAFNITLDRLAEIKPRFISVTYQAGGRTRAYSHQVLHAIRARGVDVMAHFTCVGNTYVQASQLVGEFIDRGVSSFLALRGDLPAGLEKNVGEESFFPGDLRTAAELTQLIRKVWREKHPWHPLQLPGISAQKVEDVKQVQVAVAAYPTGRPEIRDLGKEVDILLSKQAAGATMAITQMFFYAEEYLKYCELASRAGVTIPIVPGIMPIDSPARLQRVLTLVEHEYPSDLGIALEVEPDPQRRREIGAAWAARLVREVVAGGAPGVHLYAFNRHESVLRVLEGSGLQFES